MHSNYSWLHKQMSNKMPSHHRNCMSQLHLAVLLNNFLWPHLSEYFNFMFMFVLCLEFIVVCTNSLATKYTTVVNLMKRWWLGFKVFSLILNCETRNLILNRDDTVPSACNDKLKKNECELIGVGPPHAARKTVPWHRLSKLKSSSRAVLEGWTPFS